MYKLGIVTILYNCDDVLEDFILSLKKQTFKDFILYIIDNSPNEKTKSLLNNLLTDIFIYKYIQSESNIGVAAGNNIGIKEAIKDNCEFVILSNNDILINQNNLLEKILEKSINKQNSIVVPKILYFDSKKIWLAGGFFDKFRALGVHNGINKPDIPKYNVSKYITYSPTCFMLINSKYFNKIGFMDEKYFVYVDDTDFVYRAINNNIKIWYESSLEILHKVSSSTGGDNSEFYIYYSNRNKIYFIKKHYNFFLKIISLTYFLLSRCLFYIKFNSKQRKKLIKGIIDGLNLKTS